MNIIIVKMMWNLEIFVGEGEESDQTFATKISVSV